jgi:hypothetical protein
MFRSANIYTELLSCLDQQILIFRLVYITAVIIFPPEVSLSFLQVSRSPFMIQLSPFHCSSFKNLTKRKSQLFIPCPFFRTCFALNRKFHNLTLSDPTSNLVRQYDFPIRLRCRKMSDTDFVAFVRPVSEPVRRLSSCSTDFKQKITQVVLFMFLCVFLF